MNTPPFNPLPCPKCRAMSPCIDWNACHPNAPAEAAFVCPTHGGFGFSPEGDAMFKDDPPTTPLGKALPGDKTPPGG